MNIISIKLILIILAIISLFLYWIFNFIILYHLTRFGIGTLPKRIAAIFLLGSVALFSVSVILFASLDMNNLGQQFGKLGNNVFSITNPK